MSVELYSRNPRIVKLIREAVSGCGTIVVKESKAPLGHWDYVAGTAALNLQTERWAAQHAAMILTMPEAIDYLDSHAKAAHDRGDVIVIVGTDHMKAWIK